MTALSGASLSPARTTQSVAHSSVVNLERIGGMAGIAFVVLFMVGAVVSNVAATTIYPRPEASASDVQTYFTENPGIVAFLSITLAAAALSLLLFTGAFVSRVRQEGGSAAPLWSLSGGAVAATFLLLNALLAWTLTRDQVSATADAMAALHQLAFAAGGAGHVVALGMLVGAGALAARRLDAQPSWLTRLGSASWLFSTASLVTLAVLGPVIVLIPLGRFTAFIYIIATSIRMLRHGHTGRSDPKGGM